MSQLPRQILLRCYAVRRKSTKHYYPLAWHRECLWHSVATAERKREEIAGELAALEHMRQQNEKTRELIASAEAAGHAYLDVDGHPPRGRR